LFIVGIAIAVAVVVVVVVNLDLLGDKKSNSESIILVIDGN